MATTTERRQRLLSRSREDAAIEEARHYRAARLGRYYRARAPRGRRVRRRR